MKRRFISEAAGIAVVYFDGVISKPLRVLESLTTVEKILEEEARD